LSRETVALARADEPQHTVTVAALKDLQGRSAFEYGVGSQQEVERDPWTRSCEALHDGGNSWKNLSLVELASGIAPVASLANGEQGVRAPSFIDGLTRDPQCAAGLLGGQRTAC
jgi:hypothetical protein